MQSNRYSSWLFAFTSRTSIIRPNWWPTPAEVAPQWVMNGLGVAGGLMPAIGFAMLMKIMFKQNYIPYFIAGFLAAAYLELPVIAIALVGIAIAMADYFKSQQTVAQAPVQAGDVNDGI